VLLRLVLELLLFEMKPLDLHLLNDLSAMSYIPQAPHSRQRMRR
jgi:hypothetical protein